MHENDNELAGGRLCLNFTNTVAKHDGASPYDRIASMEELLRWLALARGLGAERARALARRAAAHPHEARQALKRAHELRESLYRIFSASAKGSAAPAGDLERLSAIVRGASLDSRLKATRGGYAWIWPEGTRLGDAIVWPIAQSAFELLVSGDVERVAECGGRDCAWLFLDATKNRSRKFCSSRGCGNRTRVRRHYARARAASAAVRANR